MRYFAGIDVGAKGGISIIDENANIVFCKPMSNENLVEAAKILHEKESAICCVEKVGAMPGQGVTSMFNFGKGAGFIEGVLTAFDIPYQLVPPMTWKKSFSLTHKDKQASIDTCKQLFPKANLLPTERCRKESDGMGESLLLSEYARRKFK